MKVSKKLLISLLLIAGMGLLKVSSVSAGIKDSPHDIVSWFGRTADMKTTAGICAYCHIPHSAKGDRLFPEQTKTYQDTYGKVAGLCWKCHGQNTYLGAGVAGNGATLANEIFLTLNGTGRSDATQDSHPVFTTNGTQQPHTLQNTTLDSVNAMQWPWASVNFDGAKGDSTNTPNIECSTCHNPHDWNPIAFDTNATFGTAKRKFLRAPIYDTSAPVGYRNFCSYCHQNREDDQSSNTTGTHPVSRGDVDTATATFSEWTSGALVKDAVYMIKGLSDSARVGTAGNKLGFAVWDTTATGSLGAVFIGARLYGDDHIICQSCHVPHGVMTSNDDMYSDAGTDQELHTGPLLAINNATSWGRTMPTRAPTVAQYQFTSETAYNIPNADSTHDQNLLCEWCHGMTPDLQSAANSTNAFAHPVNMYPTNVAGKGTMDNWPSEEDFGTLHIKYPAATWLKYRESIGIRGKPGVTLTAGNERVGGRAYLICESCHEPHQAKVNTPLLKYGSETTFCDGCHFDTAMGTGSDVAYFSDWTTHPSGSAATLLTKDGSSVKLPNRAGLRTFGTGNAEYITCWTCHKAHKGVEKPLLADYQNPFSQLCVNCHTEGSSVNVTTQSQAANWAYGTANAVPVQTNANPSLYYLEGSVGTGWWSRNVSSTGPARYSIDNEMRLGSHYIGEYTGSIATARPELSVAGSKGWLGERDSARVSAGILMTQISHIPGSADADAKDKWLMQQMADDSSYITTLVFETMIWYGSGQKAHMGATDPANPTKKYVICQSCHVAHNSAMGVADNPNISRLLLAPNNDSYMCKRCHIPEADTTLTHPMSADTTGAVYNTMANLEGGQNNFKYNTLVTRTSSIVDMADGMYAYAYSTVIAPANYPDVGGSAGSAKRMNCDACHSVHNADSKMGAMILEGNDSAVSTGSGIQGGKYWNKVPTIPERDDKVTCDLCHMQGK